MLPALKVAMSVTGKKLLPVVALLSLAEFGIGQGVTFVRKILLLTERR